MKVIGHKRSFSRKNIYKRTIIRYGVPAVILIILIILLVYSTLSTTENKKWLNATSLLMLFSMTLGAIVCLVYIWLSKKLDHFLNRMDSRIGIAVAGYQGEKMVFDELKKVLDDNYTVYPNYIIPGHKFDLDFLIVGPKGLIVVEAKNFSNSTLFSEDQAFRIKQLDYKQETTKLVGKADPRNQMEIHCQYLNNYLNYLGFTNINIKKVLVFAKDHVAIEGKSKIYIVKKINELGKYFNNLYSDDRFTPEFCEEVNKKLNN